MKNCSQTHRYEISNKMINAAHLCKLLIASAAYLSWNFCFRDFFRKQYHVRRLPSFSNEFNKLRKNAKSSSDIFKLIVRLTAKFSEQDTGSMFGIVFGPVASVFAIHSDAYSSILKGHQHLTKASRYDWFYFSVLD